MGTSEIQGKLWGSRAADWAAIQEPLFRPAYDAVLESIGVGPDTDVLDVGCGAGLFVELAARRGSRVCGLDAAGPLLAIARSRTPGGEFREGEMESLPYADASFDLVTGFNSFQYAADPVNALREARRVARRGGFVVAMVWGRRSECDAAAYLEAIGSCLPPPPPGAPGPFALSEDGALAALLEKAGVRTRGVHDVDTDWVFADLDTTLRGMLSAGVAVRAIQQSGEPAVRRAVAEAIAPFKTPGGSYRLRNRSRYVVGIA